MAELLIFQGQGLVFTESVGVQNSVHRVFQTLSFNQSTKVSPKYHTASDLLQFVQSTVGDLAIINRALSDFLQFNQIAQKVVAAPQIFDILPLFQTVTRKTDHVIQTLVFNQTATGDPTESASNVLIFTDLATVIVERPLLFTDVLTFVSQATAYKESPDFINTPLPSLTPTSTVVLSYAPLGLSLTLRSPVFDNVQRLEFNRINRRTRGHDLVIFRDPVWPKSEILIMTFTALSQDQVWSLLSFMKQTIGQDITLIDFENTTWTGVITTPTNEVAQEGRDCRFTASFEFQGTMV